MEKRSIFGTDGIRGLVNAHPITAEMSLSIGIAIGYYLRKNSHRRVVVSKDTRLSGYMLEYALTSGLISAGADVILVGPMPTPSVSVLIKSLRADFGVMVTASHNPYTDNGMKLFDKNGLKVTKGIKNEIEELIYNINHNSALVNPNDLGRAIRLEDAQGRYIEHVKSSISCNKMFSNFKIVLDCANGAGYKVAPTILWELGVDVISIGCEPNGFNINKHCGATSTDLLSRSVINHKADLGMALDGDADRIVVCDAGGNIINGDIIIGLIARYLKKNNRLSTNKIVISHSSNLGLVKYLNSLGIEAIFSDIGDTKIYEKMEENNVNFGAEESGHIIFSEFSNTGDGIISALQILSILVDEGENLKELNSLFSLNPQMKFNIPYNGNILSTSVRNKIDEVKEKYSNLRILVRKSGTENIIRVNIENLDSSFSNMDIAADEIVNIIK